MTRLRAQKRITAGQAIEAVRVIRERLSVIALTADEVVDSLNASAKLGIVGGTIYDAMLGRCALKSGAEIILSLCRSDGC